MKRELVTEVIREEIVRFGDTVAVVQLSGDESTDSVKGFVYLLQRWSNVWDTYVDVKETDDLEDKYKLTFVLKPTVGNPYRQQLKVSLQVLL